MIMKKFPKLLKNLIIALFWLGVWYGLALWVNKPLLLPTPAAVIARLMELIISLSFWKITFLSLGRILLGLVCAIIAGVVLAVVTSLSPLLKALFTPLISVIKSTPVASFIILLILWVERDFLPCVIVVLMALPVIWSNVSAGIAGVDAQLLEMAQLFRFSPWRKLRRIYFPSVAPHFLSALRSCLGLSWKAGVAAEVLTVPAVSIGKMLYESKLYWETLDLFAWTLVIIICSIIIEKVLMSALGSLGKGAQGK